MSRSYPLLHEVRESDAQPGNPTRSPAYCAKSFKDETLRPESELTLYNFFSSSVEKHSERPCLGARNIDADGQAGDFQFWTYKETESRVAYVASALKAHGVAKGGKVGIFGANCREWMVTMQACNRMGFVCVPIYDTLGENAIEYIIRHSETTVAFVQNKKLDKLTNALPKLKDLVKNVIYWGEIQPGADSKIKDLGITVHSFDEILDVGKSKETPPDPPQAHDVCTIMYTSGTTGDPKGVVLTHKAVAVDVCSFNTYTNGYAAQTENDVYMSYLPLAHIFDRMGEELMLYVGASIGYWRGDIAALLEDIGSLKPTIFIGVPRVFDRIYARVNQKVSSSGIITKYLYKYAFERKSHFLNAGHPHDKAAPLWDTLVFNKIKDQLGGRVKLIITGGAPIAPHTEEFIKVCFCSPVVQGYGLTETCAGTFVTIPDDPTMNGTVGPPLPFIQFMLESVPEMNYNADGDDPVGEVCIRTLALFSGYHKAKDQTDEVFGKDGWFHTGDVGTITKEGSLKLVDRKKNIFKLSQGEYIAVEKVEAVYKECEMIDQIWIYGNSFESYLVAVVVPVVHFVEHWAAKAHKEFNMEANCKEPELLDLIETAMKEKATEKKLKGFEVAKKVHLDHEQFSVDNDLLTPTFKLKRPLLLRKYQAIVDQLYTKQNN